MTDNRTYSHNQSASQGFTLVELMIAITLGLFVIGGIIFLLMQTSSSSRQTTSLSRMQENARYTLNLLADELRHAGFYGKQLTQSGFEDSITTTISNDCGVNGASTKWVYDIASGSFQYETSKTAINSLQQCVADSDFYDGLDGNGTDFLVVRSATEQAASIVANTFYNRTNGSNGCIWFSASGPKSDPDHPATNNKCPSNSDPNKSDWIFESKLYYIQDYYDTSGDGIPTLCRRVTKNAGTTKECLIEGVERFVIEFGIDSNNDYLADSYTSNPGTANIVSGRIYLLMRAPEAEGGYINSKTYNLGATAIVAPGDSYQRRVFSNTVILRNIVNLRNF